MAIDEHVIFEYCMHPRTAHTLLEHRPPPPKVDDGRVGINGKIGLMITTLVGTMICAYVFGIIALVSLPSAITSHNLTIIIANEIQKHLAAQDVVLAGLIAAAKS